MSLFSDYQNEYQSLLASAHTSIEELKNVTDEAAKEKIQKTLNNTTSQISELLEQMDMSCDTTEESKKCSEYKKELKLLELQIRKVLNKRTENSERDELFGNRSRDIEMTSQDQRNNFADVTKKLQDSDRYIDNSILSLHESLGTAAGTLSDLNAQRETIQHSTGMVWLRCAQRWGCWTLSCCTVWNGHNRLGRINDNITLAFRKAREMTRRITTERIIIAAIVVILVVTIGLVVFFKFFYHRSNNKPEPAPTPAPSNSTSRFY